MPSHSRLAQHNAFIDTEIYFQVDLLYSCSVSQTLPGVTMPAIKLTSAQRRVLKWLGKGWSSEPGAGSAIMVNGKRICNVDTMLALQRMGLVVLAQLNGQPLTGVWEATAEGKRVTAELKL